MKKTTMPILVLSVISSLFAGCKDLCASKPEAKKTTDSSATCSHCGKVSCDKACTSSTSAIGSTTPNKVVPSCSLNEKEFAERADSLSKGIFKKATSITALKDGYDIVFNQPKEFSLVLIEMVNAERSCCSGFTWALVFEPNEKATHLQVYGSKKVK